MREVVRRSGRRFLLGFDGPEATADLKHLIRGYGVGGVVLSSGNARDPGQLAELVREVQSLGRAAGADRPLLICSDYGAGPTPRLLPPWTAWPPARALGRLDSDETVRRLGVAVAAELTACGIRCDFAPVLDVETRPGSAFVGDRSLGDDPTRVGRLGAALIHGMQEGGLAACARHFPGQGDAAEDPGSGLAVSDVTLPRLEEVELAPFRAAAGAGVAVVMTAHVLYPELDPGGPATFSGVIVSERLRRTMGHDGVVVTGDLGAEGLGERWPPGDAAVSAAKAGCDLLWTSGGPDAQVEALEALIRATERGELAWKDLEDAGARIRRLEERFLLPYSDPEPKAARAAAGAPQHRALVEEIVTRRPK